MNWDALGAVAELVAAISVLATLIYLAMQIKQNTKALSGASMDSITNHGFQEIKWGADLHPLFIKASDDPSALSELETRQIMSWVIASMRNRQNEYFQWKHGALNEEVLHASSAIIVAILELPLAAEWFESARGKSVLAPDFCDYVSSVLKSHQSTTGGT